MLRSLALLLLLISFYSQATNKSDFALASPSLSSSIKATTSFVNSDVSIYKELVPVEQGKAIQLSDSSNRQFLVGKIRKNSTFTDIFDPINKQDFDNIVGGSAGITLGRFSAETGIIEHGKESTNNKQYFLQGTYLVVKKERLNISILAKIEAFDHQKSQFHSYQELIQPEQNTLSKSTNATLGVFGSYSLSARWAIVGSITSSQADNTVPVALTDEDTNHSALLGTTYSF